MSSGITVLLVSNDEEVFLALRQTLEQLGIQANLARSYAQARTALEMPNPPELVFSDAILPDGSWAEVVNLACQALTPVPVIVVTPVVDYKLYMDAMDSGAADFIMPPFSAADVGYVVRCVRENRLSPQPARRVAAA